MEKLHRRIIQKDLKDPDSYSGVAHLEPDILECEFKWAFESITMNKASGNDEIPAELSQILKDDAISAASKMPANLESSAIATGLEKFNFHSNPKEGQCQRMFKLLQKVMLNILQASSGHRTGKGQFSFQSQRKAMPKNAQTTAQLHSPHMLVK